mgnify:CR=1 FL=1
MDVWPSVLANHNWATTYSADQPAVNGVGLGGEVDAEFDDLLAGGEERLVVALFFYPPLCLEQEPRAGSRS